MDHHDWDAVPLATVRLIRAAAPAYLLLKTAANRVTPRPGSLYYAPFDQLLAAEPASAAESLSKVPGMPEVLEGTPSLDSERQWVRIKLSADISSVFGPLGHAGGWSDNAATRLVGGPNPLTAMLATGALGAGAGYGTGALLENLLPERYINKGRLRKVLAALGGAAGALPGFALGAHHLNAGGSFLDPIGEPLVKPASSHSPLYSVKMAALEDAFDRDLLTYSIYRDPYTPAPYKAVASSYLAAAGEAARSSLVSPLDVARIAVGAGSGAISGLVAGKVFKTLAGLTPQGERDLQQAGIWAGLVKNVVPMLLPRRQAPEPGLPYMNG